MFYDTHCIKCSRQLHILVASHTGCTLDDVKLDGVQILLEYGKKQKNHFHRNESPISHLIANRFIE